MFARGGARREQVEMLEDHPDRAPRVAQRALGQGGDVRAVDDDAARVGLLETVDEADERGLAGARAADHPQHRALRHREVDALDGRARARRAGRDRSWRRPRAARSPRQVLTAGRLRLRSLRRGHSWALLRFLWSRHGRERFLCQPFRIIKRIVCCSEHDAR